MISVVVFVAFFALASAERMVRVASSRTERAPWRVTAHDVDLELMLMLRWNNPGECESSAVRKLVHLIENDAQMRSRNVLNDLRGPTSTLCSMKSIRCRTSDCANICERASCLTSRYDAYTFWEHVSRSLTHARSSTCAAT